MSRWCLVERFTEDKTPKVSKVCGWEWGVGGREGSDVGVTSLSKSRRLDLELLQGLGLGLWFVCFFVM